MQTRTSNRDRVLDTCTNMFLQDLRPHRPAELAEMVGCSAATALRACRKLNGDGYLDYRPVGGLRQPKEAYAPSSKTLALMLLAERTSGE